MRALPPRSHTPASRAAALSSLTDSLADAAASYGAPGAKPIGSAYTGKWTWPYGELKHSCAGLWARCGDSTGWGATHRQDDEVGLLAVWRALRGLAYHVARMLQVRWSCELSRRALHRTNRVVRRSPDLSAPTCPSWMSASVKGLNAGAAAVAMLLSALDRGRGGRRKRLTVRRRWWESMASAGDKR